MSTAPIIPFWNYQSQYAWTTTDGILTDQSRLWIQTLYRRVMATSGGGFTAGGDLSGTNTNQTVIGLEGRPVSAAAPTNGQVLTWVTADGAWEPKPPTGATVTFAGDLSGTNTSQTVIGLRGRTVSTAAPTNGQVLTWSSVNNDWEPATPATVTLPVVVRETPAGTMNGANTTFTLSYTPNPSASFTLWLNGVEQVPTTDYSISGATITYVVAPKSADLMIAEYTH